MVHDALNTPPRGVVSVVRSTFVQVERVRPDPEIRTLALIFPA